MRTLHVGLRVDHLDRSLEFYENLGYDVVGTVADTEFGRLTLLKLPRDPFVSLELVHDPGGGTITPEGLNHLVIQVESLHDTVARLSALGIEAEEPSSPSGSEDFWTTWLTDPDGYRIELVQWPPAHSDGLTSADFPQQPPPAARDRQVHLHTEMGGHAEGWGRVGVRGPRAQPLSAMSPLARRMFDLVEPIGVIPYSADEPNEAMFALGFTNYWDTYFAGRAAPLGSSVPAGVVHALFYNFGPGEVARHIPKVWSTTTPEAAIAARQQGCVKALRRILGGLVDSPDFTRAAELLTKAATSAPLEGRPMYAALRALPLPDEPVARLFHAASLLREHRGDGHIAALMAEGIGGLEAHVLLALDMGIPGPTFGRIHHLPSAVLTDLIDTMRDRGLVEDESTFTPAGRQVKDRVEELTDELAVAPYQVLDTAELDELIAALEPLAQKLVAAQDED
jgi:catechol 2,3-dioxygenase-like lactoylglutathione lyase family enzyme